MLQAFWMGIPSYVSRRAAPGLETRAILNGPSHMGESLCSPSLGSTCLRTRSPTSSVLGRRCGSGTATAPAGTSPLGARLDGGVPPPA